ncbi:MAG TPA: hypothetical protein VIV12_10725 [Streptosporangiaceae bacterium]
MAVLPSPHVGSLTNRRCIWLLIGRPARKVRVSRRIARRANPAIHFEGVIGDVADDHVARRITGSDFFFLAADTMLVRTVVNQIACQYLIPYRVP